MARRPLIAVVLSALALGVPSACGGDDDEEEPAQQRAAPAQKPAKVDPNKDPYEITCKDIADPLAAGELTRRATNTLAAEMNLKNRSQLQVSQSLFTAFQELCKENPPEYKPARDAVKGVRSGKFKADL
jgi:hypothetical protein